MNQELREVMTSAEGRYFTPEESSKLLDEARDLERRLAVMRSVEQKEGEIVRQTVERVFQRYPKFPQERPMAHEKCLRDVAMTLRYCTRAMVENDPTFLDEKLLVWMKSVLSALDLNEISRVTYETLEETLTKVLSPPEATSMNRYVHRVVEAFSS